MRNQKTSTPPTILGLWNLEKYQPTLGAVIIFATELQMLRQIYKAEKIEVCFAGGPIPTIANVINYLDGFQSCFNCTNLEKQGESYAEKYLYVWPEMAEKKSAPWEVKTLSMQKIFRKTGIVPRFTLNTDMLISAKKIIRKLGTQKFSVAVHLKNAPGKKNESNADLPHWEVFFTECRKDPNIAFVIVGNDPTPKSIKNLPNVFTTFESNLALHLGIIQIADMFIGMASGPANAAIFSSVPYVIFKNPKQHPNEMKSELGDSDAFPFALPTQKILRKKQSSRVFLEEFFNIKKQLTIV